MGAIILLSILFISLFILNMFNSESKRFSLKWFIDMFMFIPLEVGEDNEPERNFINNDEFNDEFN